MKRKQKKDSRVSRKIVIEKIQKYFPLTLFTALLIFTRFYNLPSTSRFTRDESSNLVDIHRIYVDRDLTLIGPVDVANTIIYPSLTFYMLLPFAILGNFTTYSPAYGTAFYSVLTGLILLIIARKLKFKEITIAGLLLIVWYPLVESGRWAWNPHLVPFVMALAMYFWLIKKRRVFLTGVLFGLAFHLHYFTIFSFAGFSLTVLISSIKSKRFRDLFLLLVGFVLMIIPFVIFDLRNPPGLFFGKFLSSNLVSQDAGREIVNLPLSFVENLGKSLLYLSHKVYLAVLLGVLLSTLIFLDVSKKRENIFLLVPFLFQILAISFLPYFQGRYLLLGIVFLFLWLIQKRNGDLEKRIVVCAMLLMSIGGIIGIRKVMGESPTPPGAYVVEKASAIISDDINAKDLKNVNIAILASPDPDPLGITYRHTLLVKDKKILSESQYDLTDNLFVISTSDENTIRNDPANLMQGFREGVLRSVCTIDNTVWKVYLFNRY